jgi:hypothetical protein
MCSFKVCTEQPGMCGHEKIMAAVAVVLAIGAGAYLLIG